MLHFYLLYINIPVASYLHQLLALSLFKNVRHLSGFVVVFPCDRSMLKYIITLWGVNTNIHVSFINSKPKTEIIQMLSTVKCVDKWGFLYLKRQYAATKLNDS